MRESEWQSCRATPVILSQQISDQTGVFKGVRASLRRRAETCMRVNGNHIEQLL